MFILYSASNAVGIPMSFLWLREAHTKRSLSKCVKGWSIGFESLWLSNMCSVKLASSNACGKSSCYFRASDYQTCVCSNYMPTSCKCDIVEWRIAELRWALPQRPTHMPPIWRYQCAIAIAIVNSWFHESPLHHDCWTIGEHALTTSHPVTHFQSPWISCLQTNWLRNIFLFP